jgi:hypothetical protein
MADQAKKKKDVSGWWLVLAAGIGAGALLGAYLRFRRGFTVGSLEAHAQLGDALSPVVAYLTLAAVIAALWSVHIQQVELRETREEMKEQRKQFERTAEAQEELAKSQRELAAAQGESIRQAIALRMAQHGNSIATLESALATLEAGAMGASATRNFNTAEAEERVAARRQAVSNRINREMGYEGHTEDQLRAYDRKRREREA